MDLKINPIKKLNGEITAPGSKSYSHRAFIVASLADGISIIKNPLISGDVGVTIQALRELGITILRESEDSYIVKPSELAFKYGKQVIDCKNSGTTIRIFCALSLLVKGGLTLTGEFLKRNRPIIPLLDALKSLGAGYELSEDSVYIQRKDNICNTVKIRGDISSQFITALLIVSSILECTIKNYIEIELTTPLVSYPYVDITLDVLRSFGINLFEKLDINKEGKFLVTCSQNFRPQLYIIPGDFSSAAFMITAATLTSEDSKIIINNLNMQNPQGDKKIIEILCDMGANININEDKNQVIISGNISKYPLKGIEIDCQNTPDLFPILAVIGAFADEKTTLYNASNLRIKESDRISVMARELTKMGVKVEEEKDKLIIHHCEKLNGAIFNHENDHRIAMACSVAALFAESSSQINNIEIINDSYPTFIEDLKKLDADVNTLKK